MDNLQQSHTLLAIVDNQDKDLQEVIQKEGGGEEDAKEDALKKQKDEEGKDEADGVTLDTEETALVKEAKRISGASDCTP